MVDTTGIILLGAASFILGLSRGGLSGGFALLGALLAVQVLEPIDAAAFLLPILVLIDPFSIWIYRRHIDGPSLRVLMPGMAAGLAAGYLAVRAVDGDAVRLIVGLLAIALVADGIRARIAARPSRTLPAPVGAALGAAGGFASFLIHAGMPPVAAYLLPKRMGREAFLGTTAVLFAAANVSKIYPYHQLGLYTAELTLLSLKLLPAAFAGIVVGRELNKRMSDRAFYAVVYACILALGVRQVWLAFA